MTAQPETRVDGSAGNVAKLPAKPARKSKLLAVSPETVEPKKPKVLIWGNAGVGKTWFSLEFPGCFYIDTERGAERDHYRAKLKASGGAYLGPEQGSLDFDVVIGQLEALATEVHPYKTVIIDSITKLFNTAIIEEQMRLEDTKKKDEYGASKKPAIRQLNKLLLWINKVDMNAIIIGHEKDQYTVVQGGQREATGRTFDAHDKLDYELDFNLRVTKIGKGDSAKRFATVGKSRLIGFKEGDQFDFSYAEFAERYGRDVIEKEVKPVVLASPEQISEISKLMEVVKIPEDWQLKCFTKLGVDSWAETDTDQIDKAIQFLKGRLAQ